MNLVRAHALTVAALLAAGPAGADAVALIDSLEVPALEESAERARVEIRGQLADACSSIELFEQGVDIDSRVLWVNVVGTRRDAEVCAQLVVPFEENVELAIAGLEAGDWAVRVGDAEATLHLARRRDSASPLWSPVETVWVDVPAIGLRFPVPSSWSRRGLTWVPPERPASEIGLRWIERPNDGSARAVLSDGTRVLEERSVALSWAENGVFFSVQDPGAGTRELHTAGTGRYAPIIDFYARGSDEETLGHLRAAYDRMVAAATRRRTAIEIE